MANDNYFVKVNKNNTTTLVDPSSGDGLYRIKVLTDELKTVVNPPEGIDAKVNEINLRVITAVSNGPTGKSAYQSALDNGFVGTEGEWVASLKAGLEPDFEDNGKILTFQDNSLQWQTLEQKLNSDDILWDLGEITQI